MSYGRQKRVPPSVARLSRRGLIRAWAICAQAQEKPREPKPDEKLQEVIITGSRIARPDLDRLEPTTVVNGELFDERGYTDVGQALQELPAFGIQPSSAVNQQSGFGIAQSFVDLYSLGSQRTLTLINGRRFVSSSTATLFNGATSPGQQVDLNVVPTKLIDRIETISVGGAPIYGADAIAGTVNIILKKNFQGLDLDAQTGVSNAKDGWNYCFRALGGVNFAEGRGNITGVAELNKSDGLSASGGRMSRTTWASMHRLLPARSRPCSRRMAQYQRSALRVFRWWTMCSTDLHSDSRPSCSA